MGLRAPKKGAWAAACRPVENSAPGTAHIRRLCGLERAERQVAEVARGPTLLDDFTLRERSPIATTSAFRSASCMRAARQHVVP